MERRFAHFLSLLISRLFLLLLRNRINCFALSAGAFLNCYRPVLSVVVGGMVSAFAIIFLIVGVMAFGLGLVLIYVHSK
jgi:hypothetical protein